jgi:hypothetical protein
MRITLHVDISEVSRGYIIIVTRPRQQQLQRCIVWIGFFSFFFFEYSPTYTNTAAFHVAVSYGGEKIKKNKKHCGAVTRITGRPLCAACSTVTRNTVPNGRLWIRFSVQWAAYKYT